MLKHTFRHIHGIGEKTEKRIWAEGLTSWEEFLDSPRRAALPQWQRDLVCVELERSVRALERRDARYFTEKLPAPLHWRLYPEFGQRVAYLDIETTGVTFGMSYITVIGLYDGEQPRVYVQGQNLSRFAEEIEEFWPCSTAGVRYSCGSTMSREKRERWKRCCATTWKTSSICPHC